MLEVHLFFFPYAFVPYALCLALPCLMPSHSTLDVRLFLSPLFLALVPDTRNLTPETKPWSDDRGNCLSLLTPKASENTQ